ncbi:MAG: alcohol dehydrogenase catalytic domain-containing protein, partial [Gammaproteobacteria bacterium]|nr:alcohol dehydrogenase catalytic domain-containing protein [Gammaproteobacteria bacterium]
MTKCIQVKEAGGPEVMQWVDMDISDPGAGEVRVRHTAVGLNFIDVYFRAGTYPPPAYPFTPGLEGAGVVDAIGNGVNDVATGDRVAYASPPLGAYAEVRNIPAEKVVKVPGSVDDQTAAAMMLKGMTAEYLLCRTYAVRAGDTILFH